MSRISSITKQSSKFSEPLYYGITIKELQELMAHQGKKGVNYLREIGGIKELYKSLMTHPEFGIIGNSKNIENRRKIFGKNSIAPPKSKTFCQLIFMALNDPILIFLEIGGIFSFSVALFERYYNKKTDTYDWIEGVAIIISVLIIVLVTATTDYQKEKQFRVLQEQLKKELKIPVLRSGDLDEISVKELVVGDICLIKYGNAIPADGIIIQCNDLKIDESALTGESDLVIKDLDIDVMVLSGTYVMEGSGKILITAVGVYSQNGIILSLLGLCESPEKHSRKSKDKAIRRASNTIASLRENKMTKSNLAVNDDMQQPIDVSKNKSILQTKLVKLALNISKAAVVIAVLLVFILLVKFTYIYFNKKKTWTAECFRIIIDYIITGVSILVIAIPEGLPLAVTLALAYSVKKMTYDNNLVRNLAACETMGNATTICSDKTGTLTTNRMTCVQLYSCEKLYKKIPHIERIPKLCSQLIIEGISVNSLYTSRLIIPENKLLQTQQIGNKTECALLGLVNDLDSNYELIRMQYPENEFIQLYTFNSVRKSMSTVIKISDHNYRLYTKGASEIIMLKCRYIFAIDGKIEEFTNDMKFNLNDKVISPMAKEGLRTITIAYRDFLSIKPVQFNETYTELNKLNLNDENFIVNDLTLLCVCGIEDPVRPEVPKAIHLCQLAGITVRMVTGDNVETARSIANKCGILKSGDKNYYIMEGLEFNKKVFDENGKFQQDQFDKVWPRLRVLARSTPIDKYVLVKGIIDSKITRHREVVAVTGDGTNDGPALKIADVGFAMGIAGTDVAKEAADIIITDDNFSSIVKAVMWGRNIYDSISKFIQFQLAVNLVAVIIAVVSALYGDYSALKAVQLLWVNLIMDSLASLALATEKPTEKILLRKPYGRTKSIISEQMLVNIFCQAIYQLIVLSFILFYFHKVLNIPSGDSTPEPTTHYTLVFNSLVMMTLFNEINARKLHGEINVFEGLFENYIFLVIWITTFLLQIIIVQKGGYVFHTKTLILREWIWCILFGIGTIIWSLIYNRLPLAIYVKSYYYSCCLPQHHDLRSSHLYDDEKPWLQNNDINDDHKNAWVKSSRRLSTQLSIIRKLSTRIEDQTNKIIKKDRGEAI